MAAYAGFGGRVVVGRYGVALRFLPAGRWSVRVTSEKVNVTTGAEAPSGVNRYLAGWFDVEATVDCFLVTDQDPFLRGEPANLLPGNTVYLELHVDRSRVTRKWVLPAFLVTDLTSDSEVRGVVKYTLTGCQSGGGNALLPTPTSSSTTLVSPPALL